MDPWRRGYYTGLAVGSIVSAILYPIVDSLIGGR
jgi:hypothetical protein